MESVKIKGQIAEILEIFDDQVLVEFVNTLEIVLVCIYDIDQIDSHEYAESSNIVSMEGWLSWQEKVKHEKNKKPSQKSAREKALELPRVQSKKRQKLLPIQSQSPNQNQLTSQSLNQPPKLRRVK